MFQLSMRRGGQVRRGPASLPLSLVVAHVPESPTPPLPSPQILPTPRHYNACDLNDDDDSPPPPRSSAPTSKTTTTSAAAMTTADDNSVKWYCFHNFHHNQYKIDDWYYKVLLWFNSAMMKARYAGTDSIDKIHRDGHIVPTPTPRNLHLYLVGPPDVGKTLLLTELIRLNCLNEYVYYPKKGTEFFMDGLKPEIHKCIIFDHIPFKKLPLGLLLCLCDSYRTSGEFPTTRNKFQKVQFKGPIIFVGYTNDFVKNTRESKLMRETLSSRLYTVYATEKYPPKSVLQ